MLRWARQFGVPLSAEMTAFFERIAERPAVRKALGEEGLAVSVPSEAVADPTVDMVVT